MYFLSNEIGSALKFEFPIDGVECTRLSVYFHALLGLNNIITALTLPIASAVLI